MEHTLSPQESKVIRAKALQLKAVTGQLKTELQTCVGFVCEIAEIGTGWSLNMDAITETSLIKLTKLDLAPTPETTT